MAENIFKVAKNNDDGFMVCFGTDIYGNNFSIISDHIPASQFQNFTGGAQFDAELVARLLNWYYSDKDASETIINGELSDDCSHAYTHETQPKDYNFCPWCGGKHNETP